MFRDSRGVVHTVSSADPLRDLPDSTATALLHGLLRPGEHDLGLALDRCEAVRDLLERWQDAFFAGLPDEVDLQEEARWAAEAGVSLADVEASYREDDDEVEDASFADDLLEGLVLPGLDAEPAGDDGPAPLPEELVAVLERELLLLPLRVRLEALVAAAVLVATWGDLLADSEKLLGHLVLAHDEAAVPAAHEALADRHADLHALAGPGHEQR